MTQPTPYRQNYNFDEYGLGLAGESLNTEFQDLRLTTDEILDSIRHLQRDDWGIQNGLVHLDSFGGDLIALLAGQAAANANQWEPRGPWVTSTLYSKTDLVTIGGVTYVATASHVSSGSFATDLALDRWSPLNAAPVELPTGLVTIDNVASMVSSEGEAGQYIVLSGYYTPGDAPARIMYWDPLSTAADDGGIYFAVAGVPVGRWRSTVVDPIDIRHYGAKLDNVTDDYDAWNRALNRALRIDTELFNTKHAGTIVFPDVGISYVSQTLHCKANFALRGGSTHTGNGQASIIRNPINVGGIVIHTYNTASTGTVAYGSGADGSVIDGVSFRGAYWPSSSGTTGHGIWLRARAILRNVNVRGYAQNGTHNQVAAGAGGFLEGNTNNWYMENVRCQNNGGKGHYTDGADANAGTAINCHGDANGDIGIHESSFLGNTWITPHTAGNTTRSYLGDGLAGGVWVGCYEESGQPSLQMAQGQIMLGGTHNYPGPTDLGISLSPAGGFLRNNRGYQALEETSGGAQLLQNFGGNPDNGDIIYSEHETLTPLGLRLKYDTTFGGGLAIVYANSLANCPLFMTLATTTLQFGRAAPVPYAFAPPILMTGFSGRCIEHVKRAGGAYAAGDVIHNVSPVAGGSAGEVCTTAGNEGSTAVLKAMANLAA